MKISFQNRRAGLSLIDVVVVVATFGFVAAFLLVVYPRYFRVSKSANRITCVNNLKQVGLSFRIWADDNGGRFPNQVSTNEGGLRELASSSDVSRQFQIISSELGTPKVIRCPSDSRITARGFPILRNTNVSYFIGMDAVVTNANMLLAGDRNVKNGFLPKRGVLELTANQKIRFTKEIHPELGNILLVDGSVKEVTGRQLRTAIIPNTGFATNRILLP